MRVDALREQVESDRHQIHVAGALAVAEQAAFDAVRAGEDAELGRGHAHAFVVVRVQREHHGVAVVEVVGDVLHLVGEHVRRGHLHRGRQVDDHRVLGRRLDHADHRVAHLHRVLRFRAGERFGRILVIQVDALGVALELLAQRRGVGRELLDAGTVLAEHHFALQHRDRVVEVHNRALAALEALIGLADQVLAGLREHHDRHVIGNQLTLDEHADEVIIGFRGARETDFDLFEAHFHKHVPEAQLALGIHRIDQRLVAVAKIDGAPARCALQSLARPRALRVVERHLLVVCHILRIEHIARLLRGTDKTRRRQQRVVVPSVGCRSHCGEIKHSRLILTHHSSFLLLL